MRSRSSRLWLTFLVTAALLLPFTTFVMQYNYSYYSARVSYLENDFYKNNATFRKLDEAKSPPTIQKTKYIVDNNTHDENFLSKERFVEVKNRMESRQEYLLKQCHSLGLDGLKIKASAWEYLINRQYHVIWCNIFKAASTSWMYNFNIMANYTPEFLSEHESTPALELARKKYVRPTVDMLRKAQTDSISFLIVRHPLERLASAYNDKIMQPWPESFHEKLGKRIISKYRKKKADTPEQKQINELKYPTFNEFVSYLLEEVKHKRNLDQHWTPYTNFCTPCKFKIDIILKVETLDEDQRYLIQVAGLQDVVKPQWQNKVNMLHDINHLYSELTRAQLDGLHEFYKSDLQLFNYNMDKYYDLIDETDTR